MFMYTTRSLPLYCLTSSVRIELTLAQCGQPKSQASTIVTSAFAGPSD